MAQCEGGEGAVEQIEIGMGGAVSISRARREAVLAAGRRGRVLIGHELDQTGIESRPCRDLEVILDLSQDATRQRVPGLSVVQ